MGVRGYPLLKVIQGHADFTSPFTPLFLFRLRTYIKHSRQCFIGYSNTSNFVKNTPPRVVFSTLFSVFGYPDETVPLVFDILLLAVWKCGQTLSFAFIYYITDIYSQLNLTRFLCQIIFTSNLHMVEIFKFFEGQTIHKNSQLTDFERGKTPPLVLVQALYV